jgi:hypothetical protein
LFIINPTILFKTARAEENRTLPLIPARGEQARDKSLFRFRLQGFQVPDRPADCFAEVKRDRFAVRDRVSICVKFHADAVSHRTPSFISKKSFCMIDPRLLVFDCQAFKRIRTPDN